MKICSTCKEEKPLDNFSFDKRNKDGLQARCKNCNNLKNKEKYHSDPIFKEKMKQRVSTWYENNLEHKKAYDKKRVQENWNHISKVNKTWIENNKEKYSLYKKEYYQENKIDFFFRASKRRATKNRSTPSWADTEKIKQLYIDCFLISEMTGVKHHVDHIVPLQGKIVSGLHVETNLQIIPAVENLKKHANFNQDLI